MKVRPDPPPADRREALKSRHRRAIVDAAAALTAERGDTGFTVDRLAERADVSRRTVFNHFRSLDDILLEVFGRMLEEIVDGIGANLDAAPDGDDDAANIFDSLADAIRGTDLLTPITRLKHFVRQGGDTPSASRAALFELAMTDVGTRLSAIVLRRHPQADPLVVDLMCGAIIGGGAVIVGHWEQITGGSLDDESRRVWSALLERILSVTRDGYGSIRTA
ncbi:TetR/AcrR family transcriptional regulator [Nocardiopsis flavescens]|uniref:DNA-binding transcriptional regulator, AcrR family n=1 Tax=Nocardiopsis flavescens TaxID=758803 RepID=A0A1M6NR15_9ACTN|nr:TetR/AcrR family transcriptional regulator [Nocardiopsis flavescens]SHJ98066.1 DNA-binding transcriptional regulator, AcrR family [Nocardiopsis flavescens]